MDRRDRIKDIETQIAYTRWLSMQNKRQIANSITVTNKLKQKDEAQGLSIDRSLERSIWTDVVVRDELRRPLVLTDEQEYDLKRQDYKIKMKLEKSLKNHLEVIDSYTRRLESNQSECDSAKDIRDEKLNALKAVKRQIQQHRKADISLPPLSRSRLTVPVLFS